MARVEKRSWEREKSVLRAKHERAAAQREEEARIFCEQKELRITSIMHTLPDKGLERLSTQEILKTFNPGGTHDPMDVLEAVARKSLEALYPKGFNQNPASETSNTSATQALTRAASDAFGRNGGRNPTFYPNAPTNFAKYEQTHRNMKTGFFLYAREDELLRRVHYTTSTADAPELALAQHA